MKKLIDLKDNSLNVDEMSVFNGGGNGTGDTPGAIIDGPFGYCYSCDYNQPDGSGTINYPDITSGTGGSGSAVSGSGSAGSGSGSAGSGGSGGGAG